MPHERTLFIPLGLLLLLDIARIVLFLVARHISRSGRSLSDLLDLIGHHVELGLQVVRDLPQGQVLARLSMAGQLGSR